MSVNPVNGVAYCDWFPAITPFGSNFTGAWCLLSTGTKLYVGGLIDAINGVPHVGLARLPALTDHTLSPLSGNGGRAHPLKGRIITTAWFTSFHQPAGSHTGSKPQRCQNARVPA